MTENKKVLAFIDESAALCQPDEIIWIDGSKEQRDALRAEACSTGEMIKLNEDLLPECYLHRTAVNDVARVEDRTFICCRDEKDAGPINNWMDPKQAYKMASDIFRGSMKGRKMYVIPYSMGIVGSEFSKIGIELTDSIYVVLNMEIMTRVGTDVLEALAKTAISSRVCIPSAGSTRASATSCISPKTTPSGLAIPVTAGTCFSAKNVLRSALRPISAKTRAGWQSICSFWALKNPTAT